ncbi:MAG: hypothetical protein NVS9B1_02880 [Candidatus Dormibacteraceae bacterium]
MREIRIAVFGALVAACVGSLPIVAFAAVPPLPPSGFTATPLDRMVSLQWSAPSGNPNQLPTSYSLTYSPGGGAAQTYSAITRAATVSGLTNGVLYTFYLTAIGPGGASQPATATATPVGPSPSPSPPPPSPTPTPTPIPTIAPQPTPSPTPQGGIGVDPAAAPATSRVNVFGSGLPPTADLPLLFDGVAFDHAATDASGNLAKSVGIPDTASVGDHLICVDEGAAGKVCANFHVTPPAPSPTPAASPTAASSPSPSPVASPTPIALAVQPPPNSGSSPLGFITRPPFIFFPILLLLAALGWFVYWLWTQRPGPALGEVTVVHKAAPPRTWSQEAPPAVTPPPTGAPAPAPAPPPAIHYETPAGPKAPPPPSLGPGAPSTADVPPDLPEALD